MSVPNPTSSTPSTILVVEDDPDMALGLRDNLEFEGYRVVVATSGEEGIEQADKNVPACILLDVMLPGIDGFTVCHELRSRGVRAPIIMLTARGQEIDKVRGLELGADDYVTKPFGVQELLARIRAALRRAGSAAPAAAHEAIIGDARVDFIAGRVERDGREMALGHYETEVLKMLIEHAGEVVSRQDMLKEIWGLTNEPQNRSVDNHVVSLRRKLELEASRPRHILTIHGLGYKIVY